MMSSTSLPQEILDVIIKHAKNDRKILMRLCLVSRSFLPESQRMLYSDILLSGIAREVPMGPPKSVQFFTTLTQYNPSLARHVRSFSYYVNGPPRGPQYWSLMNEGLRLTINLKSFTLHGTYLPLMTTLFDNCSLQLHEFSWTNYIYNPHDNGNDVRQFLATQHELRSLSAPVPGASLSPTICPKLETLTGNQRTMVNVLPGRSSIKKVIWETDDNEGNLFTRTSLVSDGLSHVQVFVMGG